MNEDPQQSQPEDGDGDEDDATILFCIPPATPNAANPNARINLRGAIKDMIRNPWFQRIVLAAILISCGVMALDSPIAEYRHISSALVQTLNMVTFAIFLLEFLLKLLDHGFEVYFRNRWNLLDFVILVAQAAEIAGLDGISALRVVRVLRPLRVLSHIKKLQLLIVVMAKSMYDFGVLLIVAVFILTIAAILGVNLFAGTLYFCNESDEGLRPVLSSIDCDPLDTSLVSRGLACDPHARKLLSRIIEARPECAGNFLNSQVLVCFASSLDASARLLGPLWMPGSCDQRCACGHTRLCSSRGAPAQTSAMSQPETGQRFSGLEPGSAAPPT